MEAKIMLYSIFLQYFQRFGLVNVLKIVQNRVQEVLGEFFFLFSFPLSFSFSTVLTFS